MDVPAAGTRVERDERRALPAFKEFRSWSLSCQAHQQMGGIGRPTQRCCDRDRDKHGRGRQPTRPAVEREGPERDAHQGADPPSCNRSIDELRVLGHLNAKRPPNLQEELSASVLECGNEHDLNRDGQQNSCRENDLLEHVGSLGWPGHGHRPDTQFSHTPTHARGGSAPSPSVSLPRPARTASPPAPPTP